MSSRVSNRDRPVLALNRKPSRVAYACFNEEDYMAAERFFYSKYHERCHSYGPWAEPTVVCLNNWIVALIKIQEHEKAETICRTKLQDIISARLQKSPFFACIQCSLAASLFLSGNLVAAEELFDDIRSRQSSFANDLVQDYFEVLSLVRLTSKDCLVFRDSATHVPELHPVSDYIDQLEGLQFDASQLKKGALKSGLGSLRRMASLRRGLRQENTPISTVYSDRPLALIKRIFGRDSSNDSSLRLKLDKSDRMLASAVGDHGCPCFQHRFEGVLGPVEEESAQASVKSWLNGSAMQEVYEPSPEIGSSFDASLGLTHRSTDTTTSSQPTGSNTRSLLAITAWAADRQIHIEKQLNVLLDTGAPKSLVSLDFAEALSAPIIPADNVFLLNPDGSDLEVLGCIKVGFSWLGPSGTKFGRIQCYIVRDLQTGMTIGGPIINKLKLLDAPQPLFGPIILSSRSKKEKIADAKASEDIIAARKAEADRQAAARAAERAQLEAVARTRAAAAAVSKASPRLRSNSPMGGSDTTAPSRNSSMTFSGRSNTISTIASNPSLRTTTSSESQRSQHFLERTTSPSLSTSSNARPLHRALSGHRRADARYWHP